MLALDGNPLKTEQVAVVAAQQRQQLGILEESTKGAKGAQKKQCSLRSLRAPFTL